jgi:hypothetical protein
MTLPAAGFFLFCFAAGFTLARRAVALRTAFTLSSATHFVARFGSWFGFTRHGSLLLIEMRSTLNYKPGKEFDRDQYCRIFQ